MKTSRFLVVIVATLVTLCGFTFTDHQPDRYFLIEHVGITDKIIPTVVLAEAKSHFPTIPAIPAYLYYKYALPNVLYAKSEVIVLTAKKSKEVDDFGCFKISIVSAQKKAVYFVERKEAFKLFSNLRTLCIQEKATTELPILLNELRGRISY